jgi:hypothetical protein
MFVFILWIFRKHHLDSHKPKLKKKKKKKHIKDLDDEYNKNKPKNPRVRILNKLKVIKELKHDVSNLVT